MKNTLKRKFIENIIHFSVAKKVFAIVSISILMLIIVSFFSIWQTAKIGQEISAISARNIPLANSFSQINNSALEQSVLFERALRFGSMLSSKPRLKRKYANIVKKFHSKNADIEKAIEQQSLTLEKLLKQDLPKKEKAVFTKMSIKIAEMIAMQKNYFSNANKALGFIENNNNFAAYMLIPIITTSKKKLVAISSNLLATIDQFTIQSIKTTEKQESYTFQVLIALSITSILVSLILTLFFVSKNISKPLKTIVQALKALANEDTSINVKVNSNDEIAEVAKAYETFKTTLIESQRLQKEQRLLKAQAEEEKQKTMFRIAEQFEQSIGKIVNVIGATSEELSETANDISHIVSETNIKTNEVTNASTQASTNVQSVASATEEMSHSISEINRQIIDASNVTQRAVSEAETTRKQMSTLSETAIKIEEVVSLISDIADQTNLLALNATIESARAGEAGKGFAVVASEVKELAKDTTKATGNIVEQIKEIQQAIKNSVTSVDQVSAAIKEMDETSSNIASVMEQQGSATAEISRNVQEAANGTEEVNQNIQSVSEASEQTGKSISHVAIAAQELSNQTETLKNEVKQFLIGLREGPADRRKENDQNYKGPERRKEKARETLAA